MEGLTEGLTRTEEGIDDDEGPEDRDDEQREGGGVDRVEGESGITTTGIVRGARLGARRFCAGAFGVIVRSRTSATCTSEGGDDWGDGVRTAFRFRETLTLWRSPGMLVRR